MIIHHLADIDQDGQLVACGNANWIVLFVLACAIALIGTLMWSWVKVCDNVDSDSVALVIGAVIFIAIMTVCIGSFFVAAWLTEGSCS